MSDKDKAMQQALELIERLNKHGWILADFEAEVYAAITALKAALEQQAEPVGFEIAQPVAWRFKDPKDGHWLYTQHIVDLSKKYWRLKNESFEPLYTAPPPPLPVQEPTPWRDMVVVSLVREGVNKHKARELADHFATQPLPVQEPVAWGACVSGRVFVGALPEHVRKLTEDDGLPIQLLFTAPQRKPLTDDVLVPLEVLEAAASSLDSFCGNLGWGDADLQNMDNLFALISQHKAAHNIKEKP